MTSSSDDTRAAILAYHKIGEPPHGTWQTWNYVPTETFLDHLSILAQDGWQVIDLDRLVAGVVDGDPLPRRSAVLTFDDGYQSMLTVAEPCLAKFGHPSVLFVPTEFVGGSNQFDTGSEPEEPICTWDELRELQQRGCSVQSHSAAHRSFDELPFEQQVEELVTSKQAMEENLDHAIHSFSFPFGARGNNAEQIDAAFADAGYKTAFRYHGGVQRFPGAAAFDLRRVPVGPDTDLRRQLAKEPK
jgi:peptidoglycan/xylan/chitin deacetylase (PgdA/CDA1 family)